MKYVQRSLVCALSAAIFVAGPASSPAAPAPAVALDAIAAQYWQREQQNDAYLRVELGLPVETIRAITYENAADDAAFGEPVDSVEQSCVHADGIQLGVVAQAEAEALGIEKLAVGVFGFG